MSDIFEEAKLLLRSRKQAYETVFGDHKNNIDMHLVLKDLAQFCRANEPTFNPDPRIHALIEGRREVWLRIQKYLQTTPDELWDLTRKD